jgi:NTP pyrophosphatase (non-canonical NTP hydrolase)
MNWYEREVALLDRQCMGMEYYALGLAGETGEAIEHVKKAIRRSNPTALDHQAFAMELGDVLWYLTRLAQFAGYTLEAVARMNVHKLRERQALKEKTT